MDPGTRNARRSALGFQMDGWRESAGLSKEIAVFQALGRPIVWMEPGIVPGELL